MSRLHFIILWCILLSIRASAQPGTYIRYSTAEGLSGNYMYDIAQDLDGFLWISSNTGVYRFDGTHFRQFGTKDGLPDNEVLEISVDKYGRIWFCGFNGRVGFYNKGRFYHAANTPALSGVRLMNYAPHFYEGRENINHIAGIGGDYAQVRVNADSIIDGKMMPYKVNIYWEDGMDSYYLFNSIIYKNNRSVYKLRGTTNSGTVLASGNALYYLLSNKLYRYRRDRAELLYSWDHELGPWKLEVQSPEHIFITCNDGRVIELREQHGAFAVSRTFTDIYSPGRAWSDRKGGIWITSLADGLYYYPENKRIARAAAFSTEWPGKIITDMEICGSQLIAGFENGSIAAFNSELELNTVLLRSVNTAMMVKNVHYDRPSQQVIVSGGQVWIWQGHEGRKFTPLKLRHAQQAIMPMKDAEITASGKLYLNGIRHLFELDINKPQLVVDSMFWSPQRKYAICPDLTPGKVWYSDMDGLHFLQDGKSNFRALPASFAEQRITDIKMPKPNMLVLTTESQGLMITDTLGKVLQRILPDALHGGSVSKTKLYKDQLWLAGDAGMGMFRLAQDTFRPVLWVNKSNGLLSDNVLAFCQDGDFLYAVTAEGLQKMSMRSLIQIPEQPRLFIHSIQNKTQVWINPTGTIRLPEQSREIKLECSAIAFGNMAPVVFAYRFDGADNFIETSGPFFSIPLGFEGHKKLYLRCRKGNSAWSEVNVIVLQIPVPFFQRWPVLLALALAGLLVVLLVSHYLAEKLRKRQLQDRDLKLQVASLKLSALQAMMNPHFVFNALNAIQGYINDHDRYQANKYLAKFSKLIRGSLNSSRETKILLSKELEYISHYLDLEQLRFEDRLGYTIEVGSGLDPDRLLVPVMLLQPLAENAVIHGVMKSKKPVMITISCALSQDSLWIYIRDNGSGSSNIPAAEKTHKSLGLDMIRSRLQLLSETQGKAYSFKLDTNLPEPGAIATLQLAIEYCS